MIQQDVKQALVSAMKARDTLTMETLRGLTAGFTNELVANKKKPTDPVSDEEALAVIRREIKKRKEAAEAFRSGGREESAQKEEAERAVLEAYLPPQMSAEEIQNVIDAKKAELGVSDKKDMGRFMGVVMKEVSGKADSAVVKELVEKSFS